MKKQKKEFKWFSVAEWENEQDYLRKQHEKGWKLIKTSSCCWYHFQACEPENVVYQLDYKANDDTDKEEYVQMFQDCGWEYILDFNEYSYFRKSAYQMHGEEGIFCDDASRFDMIKRVFKGKMIPLFTCFFLLIIPNMIIQRKDNIVSFVLYILLSILFIMYMIVFVHFGFQYWKYLKMLQK